MITLTYNTPSNGDTRLSGTYKSENDEGTFETKVLYANGSIDITATENRVKEAIEQANENG
tara:strand:+ start:50 stop:232 length:183 start_codon:yes stop_codon:yes gene_type:complete